MSDLRKHLELFADAAALPSDPTCPYCYLPLTSDDPDHSSCRSLARMEESDPPWEFDEPDEEAA